MNPAMWQDALARLLQCLHAEVGNCYIWDNARRRPSFYTALGGEQQGVLDYAEYYGTIDPRYVSQNEFYQDFLRRYGMRWVLGMRTASFDGPDGILGVMRGPGPSGDTGSARRDDLARFVRDAAATSQGNSMLLERGGEGPALALTVVPLAPHSPLAAPWQRPMAMVIVSDPAKSPIGAVEQ